jgi:IS30 family transposase
MARATWLTEEEKVQISTLKKRGGSNRQIAKAINRSEKLGRNFLKLGQKYGTKSKRRAVAVERSLHNKLAVFDMKQAEITDPLLKLMTI